MYGNKHKNMKSTEKFKEYIEKYLKSFAEDDPVFQSKMNNTEKSIDKCIEYILKQVVKSRRCAYADEEIYGLAIHYYDEENIEKEKVEISVDNAFIAGPYSLTEEEKAELKEKAKQQYQQELVNQLKKPSKPSPKKEEKEVQQQMSLF